MGNQMTEGIKEGNKLIARFLNWREVGANDPDTWVEGVFVSPDNEGWFPEDLNFQEDWNSLVPVIERIESLGLRVIIQYNSCLIYSAKYDNRNVTADSKIRATWTAVVDFIQWLNQNKGE